MMAARTYKGYAPGATILSWQVRRQRPFFFARVGDGAIECLRGTGRAGHTCDGEVYTPELAERLALSIERLKAGRDTVLWGDWSKASAGSAPTYVDEWAQLVDKPNRLMVDYESLLFMKGADTLALRQFYGAVKADTKKRLYLGAHAHMVGQLLPCDATIQPGFPFTMRFEDIVAWLEAMTPQVILFGAGMLGFAAVVEYWHSRRDEVTCIHLGSALDPLFGRRSRSGQMSQKEARELMDGL